MPRLLLETKDVILIQIAYGCKGIEGDMRMENIKRKTDQKAGNKSGSFLLYGVKILEALVLIALICWRINAIIQSYRGMDNLHFGGLPGLLVNYVFVILLVPYTIHFIVTIPEKVRDIKDNERRRFEKFDALMEGYFTYGEGFRNEMVRILRLIEGEQYSDADVSCDKLLEGHYAPEEQAAVLYCKMVCQDELGFTKEAIAYGEKALTLRKGYMPALQKTVQLCLKVNKMTTAEQCLLEARETDQQEALWISMTLSRIYMAQHHYGKALETAMEWEELDPRSGEAAACVCRAAFRCGQREIADSRMEKCAAMHYYDCAALRKEMRGH